MSKRTKVLDFGEGRKIIGAAMKYPKGVLVVSKCVAGGDLTAFPEGGGFAMRFDQLQRAKYAFRAVTPKEEAGLGHYEALFGFDEGPSYRGWTNGRTWNGWAIPLFERDVMKQIVLDWGGAWDDATETGTYSFEPVGGEVESFVGEWNEKLQRKVWTTDGLCWNEEVLP